MLKRLVRHTVVLAVMLAPAAALRVHAQEFRRVDVFAGYSYANMRLGSQTSLFAPTDRNYHGFQGNVKLNLNKNIGVVLLDLGVQFGGTNAPSPFGPNLPLDILFDTNIETVQVLFGPEFTLPTRKFNAFVHGLVGVNSTGLVLSSKLNDNSNSVDLVRRTHLALGAGGGLDWNVSPGFAIRLLQADYLPTRVAGKWEDNFRASIGLVFRLG